MTGSGNFPPGRALRPEVRMNKEQEEAVMKKAEVTLEHMELGERLLRQLASVVDFGQLLPKPRTNDCPKCGQSKLMRSESMSYCQRCAYIERKPNDGGRDGKKA